MHGYFNWHVVIAIENKSKAAQTGDKNELIKFFIHEAKNDVIEHMVRKNILAPTVPAALP